MNAFHIPLKRGSVKMGVIGTSGEAQTSFNFHFDTPSFIASE